MKAIFLLSLAVSLALGDAHAAATERDLGQGLAYLRVHALPADLDATPAARQPIVLDLRYVTGGDTEAAGLLAWLKQHAGVRTPIFLLANVQTSAALLAPLNSPEAVTGLVILGAAAKGFEPDIALAVTPEAERRAYDALEQGAALASLVIARDDKPRNDEATLAKARMADDTEDDDAPKPEEKPKPILPPQIIDPVLQRAVQLDRSLLALKRL